MEFSSSKFVFAAPDIVWRPSVEEGTAVYMLGRDLHFVACGSPREMDVRAAGGVRVGSLRFDRDPTERSHRRAVEAATPETLQMLADLCAAN